MRAIIPTAGVGARLRPFTHTIPKVLLQVADKPILGHILDKLTQIGVEEVTCVVGYLGKMVEEYVQASYPDLRSRFVEQAEPRGLGHAIHLADDQRPDPLLIILGDTIIDADLAILRDSPADMIGVHSVDDPRRFGVVELAENNRILSMIEKPEHPPTNQAIVGVYYLKDPTQLFAALARNVQQGVLTKGEVQLTDALQQTIDQGALMRAFPVDGWHDCGKPESLLATNRALLEQRFQGDVEELRARFPGVRINPPVYLAPQAQIADSIIGPNVAVAQGAQIKRSIVENTIVNADAQVHGAILADSIIGNGAVASQSALRLYVGDKSEVVFD